MKILGIGESIIDNVYLVENESIGIDKVQHMIPKKHIGGPVLAALIVLARLGQECTFVTSLGRDEEADTIKRELKHEKIKVIGKIQTKTKSNTIIVPATTGQRIKVRGTVSHVPIKDLDRKFLHQFDFIIMDRHEQLAFHEVMKKKRSTTKVLIDPSTEVSHFTNVMIAKADYPIIPIESLAKSYAGEEMLAKLHKLFVSSGKTIVVTAGELGCIIYDGIKESIIPAYDIHPVDTLGAGDVYRGAFTYGIIQGWDITKTATFSNFVAALQCTKLGNVAAIPTKSEMDVFSSIYTRKPITLPEIQRYYAGL